MACQKDIQVPNSYAGFGNPSAGGLARGMRPPDFRSILQNDVQTAPVVSEPVSVGKNQNNNGGLVLKPLDSLAGGGSGVNGFGADAGSGQNLQPPDLRSNLQTDSGNPSAGVSNFSGQNGFAEGRPLKAPDAQAEIPESTGGLGEPAARRLSGERRARPPDFRSILQNDVETAPVVNEPVSFGNNQDNNGGLVLKPLDSLAGGGSGLNGVGADAGFGQNLKPPDFRSNLQTDSGNPSAGISNFSGQSGFANGGLVLKPVDSLAGGASGLNGVGADAGFGQNLKPPDFRSNPQTDGGNPSVGISSFPGQSGFANGGLVLKPLDSLAGGASGLNGVGADAGFGQNLKPPDFRSNLQTDGGNPSVGISSFPGQSGFANGGLVLKPLDSLAGGASGLNIVGADAGFGQNLKPPDFRSNPQTDSGNPSVGISSFPGQSGFANGGLVLKPVDSLADGGSGLNGFGADAGFGQNLKPPDFRSNPQTDGGNPSAGISSFPGQSGFANGGLVLKPLDSLAGGGSGLNGFGADAGFGQNLKPPDFRSNLQTDGGNPSVGISSFCAQDDSAVKPFERQAEMPGSLGDVRSDFGEAGAAKASAAMLGLDETSVICAMCPAMSQQFRPPSCSNMMEIGR